MHSKVSQGLLQTHTKFFDIFYLLNANEKYIFYHFKIFFTKLVDLGKIYIVFNSNTFWIECKEGVDLMLIKKKWFFSGKKRQSPHKKMSSIKNFLSDLISKLLILFVHKKILWWRSSNWCVEKYIASELHSERILRVWYMNIYIKIYHKI